MEGWHASARWKEGDTGTSRGRLQAPRRVVRPLPMERRLRAFDGEGARGPPFQRNERASLDVSRGSFRRWHRSRMSLAWTSTPGRGTEGSVRRFLPIPRVQRRPVRSLGHRRRRLASSWRFEGTRTTRIPNFTPWTCRRTVRPVPSCAFACFGRVSHVACGSKEILRACMRRICFACASRRRPNAGCAVFLVCMGTGISIVSTHPVLTRKMLTYPDPLLHSQWQQGDGSDLHHVVSFPPI